MKNAILYISPVRAREIALEEAGATRAAFRSQRLERDGDRSLYALDYSAGFMDYVCYIDAASGEVLGFSAVPAA